MAVKNYGAGSPTYLDPEGRSWETVVYQVGKPVSNAELLLSQDVEQDKELALTRKALPSGWMAGDFLNARGGTIGTDAFASVSAVANELSLHNNLTAYVNGWTIPVAYTNSASLNVIGLGAGPAGAAAKRSDFVILEVWRRLIDGPPSTVGKSQTARIWRNGNVKVPSGSDVALNYADDLIVPLIGALTTQRVQVQYRLRVVPNIDVLAHPYGFSDPVVVANTVPAAAASPDGVATLFGYTNQSANGDPGLWRAGDGNPANTIGSVDGYMYAIPLCTVFRRNTTAFNRNTNHNGGVSVSPGPTDRPDGLFHDIIDLRDIYDMRMGVSPAGWDLQEVCEKAFNSLLDNDTLTELTTTTLGGGVRGAYHLWADEIGISNAHGGDGVTTGDTPGAEFVGEFDAIRRGFSDRTVVETVTLHYLPVDGSGGGPNWTNGDVLTIDPTALRVYPYTPFNWASFAPSNISFVEITEAYFIGSGAGKDLADLTAYKATGLGVVPQVSASLTVTTVPAGVTDEPLYVRVIVSYPRGIGLSKTPTHTLGSAGLVINNPGQLPATNPIYFEALETQSIDAPHRELFLTYRTVTQTISFSAQAAGVTSTIRFPERVLSISSTQLNGGAYGGTVTVSADGFSGALSVNINPGDELTIQFKAARPLPQNNEQITLFYYANAAQTVREAMLGTTLSLIPRFVSNHIYTMSIGSGSKGTGYPFPQQYVQMPGIYPSSGGVFTGDHELNAPGRISIQSFTSSGGLLKLPTLVPMVTPPDGLTLLRSPGDIDVEGRSYFKEVPGATYVPNAFAEPLSTNIQHRTCLPVICEVTADGALGFRGQLVLVVFNFWTNIRANVIIFTPTLASNFGSASVYRIKGNLLNGRLS